MYEFKVVDVKTGHWNPVYARTFREAYRLAYVMLKRRLEPCPALTESREDNNE